MWPAGEIDLSRQAGTIDVRQAVSEAAERQRFVARQQRNLEWIALKAWWQATRRLKAAEGRGKTEAIAAARRDLIRTVEVFGPTLTTAREKWKMARLELRRRGYQRLD